MGQKKTIVYIGEQEYLSNFLRHAVEAEGLEFFSYGSFDEIKLSFEELEPDFLFFTPEADVSEVMQVQAGKFQMIGIVDEGESVADFEGEKRLLLKKPIDISSLSQILGK